MAVLSVGACRPIRHASAPRGTEPTTPQGPLSVEWRWHEEGFEIFEPSLSSDGGEVVFERRRHVAEAEPSAEDTSEDGEALAVPEVVIARVGSQEATRCDWGSSPVFSDDGRAVAFIHVAGAPTGEGDQAEPSEDDEVSVFEREPGRTRGLARPTSGSPLIPTFTPSGGTVVYVLYHGPEASDGVETVSLETGASCRLRPPDTRRGFYGVLWHPRWVHGHLLAVWSASGKARGTRGRRVDDLVDLSRRGGVLYSWPERADDESPPAWFARAGEGEVLLVDGERWVTVSLEGGEANTVLAPNDVPTTGAPSPDGGRLAWFDEMDPPEQTLTIHELPDGRKRGEWKPDGSIEAVTWSPRSDRLLATVRHVEDDRFLYDELVLLVAP
jgi:hypothetical protein